MPVTHVALLRGINVGTAKRVRMADLRRLIEGLGGIDVRTLLNSGNVVFSVGKNPGDFAGLIGKALVAKTGVSARVTVIPAADLAMIVRKNPLLAVADDPSRFLVSFFNRPADANALKPLVKQDWSPEALAVGSRAAYLWCADGILKSPLWSAVGKALSDGVTSRNWATVLKLHALVNAETWPPPGMNPPKLNRTWHETHRMPAKATLDQRARWHLEHCKHCGCRPIPASLAATLKARGLL
jgi:uncharacterized protein (DUF1697 family)